MKNILTIAAIIGIVYLLKKDKKQEIVPHAIQPQLSNVNNQPTSEIEERRIGAPKIY